MNSSLKACFLNATVSEFPYHVSYRRHQHLEHEAIAVEKGSYRCLLNGKGIVLRPFSLALINPGDWHEDAYEPPMRYSAFRIKLLPDGAPEHGSLRLLRRGLPAERHCLELDGPAFKPLLSRMLCEKAASDMFSGRVLDALASEFVWLLARRFRFEDLEEEVQRDLKAGPPSGLPRLLSSLFDANLSRSLDVPEMARALGMSESSLAHRCKTELGASPAAAFARHKMFRAFELLSHTQMSIKEVGDFLGFRNPYHFSKVFKRVHGVPPGGVRSRIG